jgi:hypothetical protein
MSEYQFIEFLAVDQPVSKKNLAYMHKQSTRAEISEWRFTNEYHFGDFRGNAAEMLRCGYDVHLHYANFGIRKIMLRLPGGLPCEKSVFSYYTIEHCIVWDRDKQGAGGILTFHPEADAGTYVDEPDVESLAEGLVPLRQMLIRGDLRPLFLAWLACCYDMDAVVPPIPAGLGKLTRPLKALVEFYEISPSLIRRAARDSLAPPPDSDENIVVKQWIAQQGKADLQKFVMQLLSNDAPAARSKIMADIRSAQHSPAWPTVPSKVTYGELCAAAGV